MISKISNVAGGKNVLTSLIKSKGNTEKVAQMLADSVELHHPNRFKSTKDKDMLRKFLTMILDSINFHFAK